MTTIVTYCANFLGVIVFYFMNSHSLLYHVIFFMVACGVTCLVINEYVCM